jgi:acyl dehydratase
LTATGRELDLGTWVLGRDFVEAYLKAVGSTSAVYRETGAVPPMAVAARALGAFIQALDLPPGAIHASQELECGGVLRQGDRVRCVGRVSRPRKRGDWSLMTAEFQASRPGGGTVVAGKSTVLVPASEAVDG